MKQQEYKSIKSWKSKLFYSALLTVPTSPSRLSLETVWVMVVSFAFLATFTLLSKRFHSTGMKSPQYRSQLLYFACHLRDNVECRLAAELTPTKRTMGEPKRGEESRAEQISTRNMIMLLPIEEFFQQSYIPPLANFLSCIGTVREVRGLEERSSLYGVPMQLWQV